MQVIASGFFVLKIFDKKNPTSFEAGFRYFLKIRD